MFRAVSTPLVTFPIYEAREFCGILLKIGIVSISFPVILRDIFRSFEQFLGPQSEDEHELSKGNMRSNHVAASPQLLI